MPVRPPKDINQLAAYIVSVSTGETDKLEPPTIDPQMQALSKLGASKGGRVRARLLSATKRKAIAKKAAKTRWSKSKKA